MISKRSTNRNGVSAQLISKQSSSNEALRNDAKHTTKRDHKRSQQSIYFHTPLGVNCNATLVPHKQRLLSELRRANSGHHENIHRASATPTPQSIEANGAMIICSTTDATNRFKNSRHLLHHLLGWRRDVTIIMPPADLARALH